MKKYLFILFLGLFLFSLVAAAPPIQRSVVQSIGIELETPIIEFHPINMVYKFHVHAHNASDGLLLDNTTTACFMHLYNQSDGGHIIEANMSFDSNGVDFEYEVAAGNFTSAGQYAALYYCEVVGQIGGFVEYPFYVTNSGNPIYDGDFIFYAITGCCIVLIGFFLMWVSTLVNEPGLKIFFFLLSFIFILAGLLLNLNILVAYGMDNGTTAGYTSVVLVVGILLVVLLFYFMIKMTVNALDLYNIKKGYNWRVRSGSTVTGSRTSY